MSEPKASEPMNNASDPSPIETALDLLVFAPIGLALTVGEEVPKLAAKGRARLDGPFGAALMVGRFAVAQGRRELDRRTRGLPIPGRGRATAPVAPVTPTKSSADAATGGVVADADATDESSASAGLVIVVDEPVVEESVVDEPTTPATAGLEVVGSDLPASPALRRRRRTGTSNPAGTRSGTMPDAWAGVAADLTATDGAADSTGADSAGADVPAAASLAIPGYDSLSASQVVQRLAGLSGPELEAVRAYETARRGRRTILARVTQLQAH